MESSKASFFERLARRCARHPWYVIVAWIMLLAIAAGLFATVFTRNMTTVTEFTTNTDSKQADDLFKERFPQAAYKVENAVITSDTYTAGDPEFWAYVDALYAKLQPLIESGVVKGVQYYDPALREGLPLMPAMAQQMVDAISLALNDNSTSAQLIKAAADLQASAAHTAEVANGLTDNLTASGQTAKDGMLQAADGAKELAGTLLLNDALRKLHSALVPIAQNQTVTRTTLLSTVQSLRDTAPTLRTTATSLDATGPGTSNRPTLISGLRDTANGLEEVAGLYWLRDGITKTYNALKPIAENQTISTASCRSTADMLRATAPDLRAAATDLERTGPGTVTQRPTLISGLRDAANGLEEIAGLYWLRDGLTKTYNALAPMAAGTYMSDEERDATSNLLWSSAPDLRAAAIELERTGPGTVTQRPTLISGLRQAADGLEELAGVVELKNCAQKGLEFAQLLTWELGDPLPTAEQVDPAVAEMAVTDNRLLTAISKLEATLPGTAARHDLIDGLNQAHEELVANETSAQTLQTLVDGMPLTAIPLAIALGVAQSTVATQAQTAQDGLDQIQTQCTANIGQAGAGLTQLQTQCNDNLGVASAGLTQMTSQCFDQLGTARDGLTQMHSQLAEQLPTAVAGVAQAVSGNEQAQGLVSPDKHTTLFAISMSEDADEAAKHITELRECVLTGSGIGVGADSFVDGFRVRMVGGTNVSRDMQDVAMSDLKKSLSYAVPIALVILLIVFGTLAAATLPLVLSIISIIVALGIAAVVGIWMPLNFAIENIVFMLGLALGIDHALFLAYRYREERRKGRNKIDAIAKAGGTAGHAIFYAGLIVVIALFGIFMIPCNMHKSLALGAIIVVIAIAPASITLLPAVLSLLGNRFDWGRLPWQKRITDIEQPKTDEGRGFWHWVTRPAMKFTVVSFLLCAAIIIACITPMFHMRLGYSYVDTLPPNCVSRSGFDAMMQAGYPSFLVAPLDIAIDGYDKPEVKAETDALIQRLNDDGGFVTAVPMEVNDSGDVAWKRIFLNQDPFTAKASDKVKQLRSEIIGDSFTNVGGKALVTGYGAFNNDFVAVTQNYTTPVLIFVLGLSLLLMLVAFRSVLFAVVCTVFNLLSVYAAYGLVVFVFQDGHGLGLYKQIQGIDAYVPIFLLCGLFGISMDYFVFVLSRNRERFDETGNMSEAIMYAFRRTGLVVLGAAAVMLVVFFAFSVSQIVIVAELGFGLVVSVLIDATLITLVMSPATMKLLGKWFWWWPSSLNWVPDMRAKPASEEVEPEGLGQTAPEGVGYSPNAPASTETHWPAG